MLSMSPLSPNLGWSNNSIEDSVILPSFFNNDFGWVDFEFFIFETIIFIYVKPMIIT